MVLSLLFLLTSFFQQHDWLIYHQDKKVDIYFKSHICDDRVNDFKFEYYLIKIKNKTDKTLVINFFKGKKQKEEEKIAFVLNPFEIKTGSCEYSYVDLKIFKSENSPASKKNIRDFNISKIEVVEVN
ncbi:MAG: hypothetical protein ACJ0PP_02850 [Flavobacteriaceae bacterium]